MSLDGRWGQCVRPADPCITVPGGPGHRRSVRRPRDCVPHGRRDRARGAGRPRGDGRVRRQAGRPALLLRDRHHRRSARRHGGRDAGLRQLASPEIRRKRDWERWHARRAADGRPLRTEYLDRSLLRRKPWELEGISRATWYRCRETSPSGCVVAEPSGCATVLSRTDSPSSSTGSRVVPGGPDGVARLPFTSRSRLSAPMNPREVAFGALPHDVWRVLARGVRVPQSGGGEGDRAHPRRSVPAGGKTGAGTSTALARLSSPPSCASGGAPMPHEVEAAKMSPCTPTAYAQRFARSRSTIP